VLVLDLTALAAQEVGAAFVPVTARYDAGDVVIDSSSPFVAGNQIGIFFTNGMHDSAGKPLVPSPISVLLRLRGMLVDAHGKSTISTVADGDAELLELGRAQLAMLFDNPMLSNPPNGGITGGFLTRENLVYTYAFAFAPPP